MDTPSSSTSKPDPTSGPPSAAPVAEPRLLVESPLSESPPADPPAHSSASASANSSGRAALEVLLIAGVFFLFAGWPPPDVNEAHYLGKARHYWDASWCPGDLFLDSADAHGVFYWTVGWLTKVLSLPAAAWVGRAITWLLLAWAWRSLSQAIAPAPWLSVLTALTITMLIPHAQMAGEWLVGGVEAKGFAYVLVIWALRWLADRRWLRAGFLLGAATAFHVLVGGWAFCAAGFAWLVIGRQDIGPGKLALGWTGGLLLALPGLLPALWLNAPVDAEAATLANQVYVYERLPHHLVIHRFPTEFILRHALLGLLWAALLVVRPGDGRRLRMNAFVAGAVLLALAGAAIDQSLLRNLPLAASLLRFYWYRLSDVLLPIGFVLSVAGALVDLNPTRPDWARAGWLVLLLASGGTLAAHNLQRQRDLRPAAVRQPLGALISDPQQQQRWFRDWVTVCRWIRDHTPPESRFLTPRHQQTFKWYAHRAEAVNWKDVPQDAAALLDWRRRFRTLYTRTVRRFGLTAHSDAELIEIGRQLGANYVIIDRTLARRTPGLPRVYPRQPTADTRFSVYQLAHASPDGASAPQSSPARATQPIERSSAAPADAKTGASKGTP